MSSVKAFFLALSVTGGLAAPSAVASNKEANPLARRASVPNSQGQNNGFFYSAWSDGTGNTDYENGPAGQYSLTWSGTGDVVVGKGFNPGANRVINYEADYEPASTGYSFLSVYGWLKDPLTEYYICESWGQGNPGGGDGMIHKGSFQSDGGTYDVFQHQQVNAPSIEGTTNFMQYWSIRTEKRTSGSVNTTAHFDYWKSLGFPFGSFDYQILATEGVSSASSGKSSVTVSEGDSGAGSDSGSSAPAASSSSVSVSAAAPSASSAPSVASSVPSVPSVVAPSASSYVPASQETSAVAPATSETTAPAAPIVPSETTSEPSALSTAASPSLGSAGGLPGAGYTPGAGFPFGYTPGFGATPTPHSGHHHRHHGFGGGYPRWGNFPRPGGAPSAASQGGAPSATAEAEPSEATDDC